MLDHIIPEDLLFLDIETVPQISSYHEMDEVSKKLWDKKAQFLIKEGQSPEDIFQRSGIYSEFGKIICISVGHLYGQEGKTCLRIKSLYGDDEKQILIEFREMLIKYEEIKDFSLCAHNGKEFDFPYISRRMLVNFVELPLQFDSAGKKPWEIKHVDTMELWKFGDYKNYTSLEVLTHIFNIPTPKGDIDGSQVAGVYYIDKDMERIVKYCEKDVIAIVQLILNFKGRNVIPDENIEIISNLKNS